MFNLKGTNFEQLELVKYCSTCFASNTITEYFYVFEFLDTCSVHRTFLKYGFTIESLVMWVDLQIQIPQTYHIQYPESTNSVLLINSWITHSCLLSHYANCALKVKLV